MKSETKNFVFATPSDSGTQNLTILQKPIKGAPYVMLAINDLTDITTLRDFLLSVYPKK